MIMRTSFAEFGHCTNCNRDFNSEELWEDNIEKCPVCDERLYLAEDHLIPELIDERE